ncbi:hypothetical protein COCMIDRAFT_103674 [Bipolaris oryzae ATCC 44560]|uniref:Cyclin N-terminal domain-containing protein n=1 Tax=Bipolaris oryzae ATCC 44560 TaxID=930090 RepID=W6ZFU0_COCMI|nr:uncharacterized protein COCMIDRAFT_103674 [Bipolaris oryzae ATCC 44560]EUC42376.1 hypothetical protein COCMIDRAFT_103674 [Bipolaris oryzae ATCC 44560]
MEFSPALSMHSDISDMTDEELDKYFASCVPLSNLPTPPPAKEPTPARPSTPTWNKTFQTSQSSQASTTPPPDVTACPTQLAYATHLANLVPLNVSTHRPHASVIQGFLMRAGLPDDIVAFAACILDGLSSRFAGTWRDFVAARLSPDVIILASLSLAHGFLVDRMRSSRHWSIKESNGAFSVQQIEATKRAILHDMDYGLSRISNDMVQRRLKNMQPTNPSPVLSATQTETVGKEPRRRNMAFVPQGAAIWQHGVQTPEPSP